MLLGKVMQQSCYVLESTAWRVHTLAQSDALGPNGLCLTLTILDMLSVSADAGDMPTCDIALPQMHAYLECVIRCKADAGIHHDPWQGHTHALVPAQDALSRPGVPQARGNAGVGPRLSFGCGVCCEACAAEVQGVKHERPQDTCTDRRVFEALLMPERR
jgi:hypothetical protein